MLNSRILFWFLCTLVLTVAVFTRFYRLDSVPTALYWEEVALGYDAYSILKTGKDHHGTAFPIVAFESFGDWKPSLYFYALVPSIAIFGLTEWAVRVPAAVSGVLIVVGVGMLIRLLLQLTSTVKSSLIKWYQLVAMAVTAISPWAVIFSRGGWEANLATALIVWGVVFFLHGVKQSQIKVNETVTVDKKWFLLGVLCLCLSMYAYHSARTIAPLVGLSLVGSWYIFPSTLVRSWSTLKTFSKRHASILMVCLVSSLVFLLPLLLSLGNKEIQQRFSETNIFADMTLLEKSTELQHQTGGGFISKLLFSRYLIYGRTILFNLFSHFSLDFLFISGDINIRHSVQYVGQLYHIELLFLLLGAYSLVRYHRRWLLLLGTWLGVALITASLTKAVPHALRILPSLPVWMTVITLGIVEAITCISVLLTYFKKSTRNLRFLVIVIVVVLIYVVEFTFFWRFYMAVFPQQYAGVFNDGYKEMIATVTNLSQEHPELPIAISRELGRPAMYYWFYTQTDPREVQAQNASADKDQGEYLSFNNVIFPIETRFIKRPSIVALTPVLYRGLIGTDPDDKNENLRFIRNKNNELVWIVFIL